MGDELVEVECWKYMVCSKGLFMYVSVDYFSQSILSNVKEYILKIYWQIISRQKL